MTSQPADQNVSPVLGSRSVSSVPVTSPSMRDRLFLKVYFGSHKIRSAFCTVLGATDAGIGSEVTGIWFGLLTREFMGKLDVWYYTRGFAIYGEKDYNRS